MSKTTAKCFQSTGGFVWVRSGGMSPGVFVVGLFCYYVKIAQGWCSTRKDSSQTGSGHTLKTKNRKTGILVVLGSKRVMNVPVPNTSVVFVPSVQLRLSSVFVFLHFMVNLIEEERALQSCSTTITSLSVSSSAGSDDISNDLLLERRKHVCARKMECVPFCLVLC